VVHRPISLCISLHNFIFKLFLYLCINSKEAPNILKISMNAAVSYYSWEQSKDSIDAKLSDKIRVRGASSNTPAGFFFLTMGYTNYCFTLVQISHLQSVICQMRMNSNVYSLSLLSSRLCYLPFNKCLVKGLDGGMWFVTQRWCCSRKRNAVGEKFNSSNLL